MGKGAECKVIRQKQREWLPKARRSIAQLLKTSNFGMWTMWAFDWWIATGCVDRTEPEGLAGSSDQLPLRSCSASTRSGLLLFRIQSPFP